MTRTESSLQCIDKIELYRLELYQDAYVLGIFEQIVCTRTSENDLGGNYSC